MEDCSEKGKTVETGKVETSRNNHRVEFMEDNQQDSQVAQEEILEESGVDVEKTGETNTESRHLLTITVHINHPHFL